MNNDRAIYIYVGITTELYIGTMTELYIGTMAELYIGAITEPYIGIYNNIVVNESQLGQYAISWDYIYISHSADSQPTTLQLCLTVENRSTRTCQPATISTL